MSGLEIAEYYEATKLRKTRDDLIFAVEKITEPRVAIDCGCGAGPDIKYLLDRNFTVHGFDLEKESIDICTSRFSDVENVFLTQSSFCSFNYPNASLVVADSSLFFCPRAEFDSVWEKIYECIYPGGVFCGSFLGSEDTMAIPGDNPSVFWPDVLAFEESEVNAILEKFNVLRFNTHKSQGETSKGVPHNWHIFEVVAQKPDKFKNENASGASLGVA